MTASLPEPETADDWQQLIGSRVELRIDGRMVRTGSCYTCRDCGTNTGCS